MTGQELDRVLAALWPQAGPEPAGDIYGLLDGARDPRIAPMLRGSLVDSCCLYLGAVPRELAAVAPYLVAMGRRSPLTARVVAQGWGHHWGVCLATAVSIQDLRRHFRRWLQVRDEAGRRLLFRFYDPRVLRVYLTTCTVEDLRAFFGPVERFITEGDAPGTLVTYRRDAGGLVQERVDLAEAAPRLGPSPGGEGWRHPQAGRGADLSLAM